MCFDSRVEVIATRTKQLYTSQIYLNYDTFLLRERTTQIKVQQQLRGLQKEILILHCIAFHPAFPHVLPPQQQQDLNSTILPSK
jgi:hypothetical protein